MLSVKPLFKRFERFESVFSRAIYDLKRPIFEIELVLYQFDFKNSVLRKTAFQAV